ncbi:MAG: chemotaxis protein CheW, partial [Myxococcota bacterium]
LWQSLVRGGEVLATEEDYEHGYKREVRQDLQQYVAFRVGDERYGVPIADISEIAKVFETTPVPRTADFVLGIGNVRGSVIPVVELATRLMLPGPIVPSPHRRILIVRRQDDLYGVVVDEVYAVVTIAPEALEDAPGALAGPRGDYIQALARYEGQILIVLDLSTVLDPRDFVRADVRRRAKR